MKLTLSTFFHWSNGECAIPNSSTTLTRHWWMTSSNIFPLSEWLPKSNVFPSWAERAAQSTEAALKVAKDINGGISKQTSGDAELAKKFGSKCETSKHLLAKRFGLRQGEKVRLIDDWRIQLHVRCE